MKKTKKSDVTRERVLDGALRLFRKRGFEATTMRDIAAEAGLALGSAYYYYPSKEAILFAYYARNQLEHEALTTEALVAAKGLRAKLGVVMHAKLKAVARERKLLGALVPRLADPSDPVSAFSVESRTVRDASIALFVRALDGEPLSDEVKQLVGPALWMLHLGFMLYFVHDRSAQQGKTHRLVDDVLDLVVPLVYLGSAEATAPIVAMLARALEHADLLKFPRP